MIEIGLAVLLVAAAVAVLLPGATGIDVLPVLGHAGVAALLAGAAILLAAGLARRALRANPALANVRTARLTTVSVLAIAFLSIALPFAAGPVNLVRIGGTPLGYYIAAQGALVGLVILAFVWAGRQDRIETGDLRND